MILYIPNQFVTGGQEGIMSIVVNLRYQGLNGNAVKFAQEKEQSGAAERYLSDDGGVLGA